MLIKTDSDKLIKQFVDEKGNVIPGFSGIGKYRGRSDYTEEERVILNHFFTNVDSNVYCAKDSMPNQLWALVMGQYARSNATAKDRLLQLFNDMHKRDEKELSIPQWAETIRKSSDISKALEGALIRAGNFVETWGVAYGHDSLRDSDMIRICIEGISQRMTKKVESAREGAYQEQSTRAIPFRLENLGMPFEVRGTPYEERFTDLGNRLTTLYDGINEKLKKHLDKKYSYLKSNADQKVSDALGQNEKLPEKRWQDIINAKAFDIARYLLPQNMTTSLGITLTTRRFQDQTTEWQSSPYAELQVLGRIAQIESMKISQNLMKYGNPSEFYQQLPERKQEIFESVIKHDFEGMDLDYKHYNVASTLITHTPEIEDWILASILFNAPQNRYSIIQLKKSVEELSIRQRKNMAKQFLNEIGTHDLYPKEMEIGSLTFERFYDIGAYRDLQRHRGDRQQCAPYKVIGYNMPSEIAEIGMEKEFIHAMHLVLEVHELIAKQVSPFVAEYVPVMGNMIYQVTTRDPVQQFYEARLRTIPAGIDSYRSIAQQEMKQTLNLLPAFKGLVKWDEEYYDLGRLDETVNGHIREQLKKREK
jgi:thymidylate synthase ThyX